MPARGLRIAAGVMSAIFVLSAGVQWNDPDPVGWIALYGSAAVLAALAASGRLPWIPNLAMLALSATLTAAWVPSLFGARPEAFQSFEMQADEDEAPREAGGLALVTLWSAFQTCHAQRVKKARRQRRRAGGES